MSAITTPWAAALASSHSMLISPVNSSAASPMAFTRLAAWPHCSTVRFGTRSATTPPNMDSRNDGIAPASPISPTAAYEPVST